MSELTDKMRTCAAYLVERMRDPVMTDDSIKIGLLAMKDAVDLLLEGADLLERGTTLGKQVTIEEMRAEAPIGTYGEPMALLDAKALASHETLAPQPFTDDAWVAPGGPLPGAINSGTRSRRACPQCGSFGYKRVFRRERQMFLHCGACGKEWLFNVAARVS